MRLRTVVTAALVTVAVGASTAPRPVEAQFGRLKRLVSRPAPDTAGRASEVDTAASATLAAPAVGGVGAPAAGGTAPPPARSRLARAALAARQASRTLESVTGVSVKDAALAATGVGAGALAARKLGVDPAGLASQVLGRGAAAAAQRGALGQIGRGLPGASLPATPVVPAISIAAAPDAADLQALASFQQELVRVTAAAGAGDARAQARLQTWQAIALRYQPAMARAALAAQAGDAAALRTIERLQLAMLRDWARAPR